MNNFLVKNKFLISTAVVVGIALLLVYFVPPSIIGYNIYKKIKDSNYSIEEYGRDIEQFRTDLLVSKSNLSFCNDLNNRLFAQMNESLRILAEKENQLGNLKANATITGNNFEECVKDIYKKDKELRDLAEKNKDELERIQNEKNKEAEELKSKYDSLAANSARSICCKAKVDNEKIKYYDVQNNKIVCLEDDGILLSC